MISKSWKPPQLYLQIQRHGEPDVLVLSEADRVRASTRHVALPIAAFGVLSPSTAERDRVQKCARYLLGGVKEVWLVEPETETIEVRTSSGADRFSSEERAESKVAAGFSVSFRELAGG